jgi:hypothetical protein
MNEYYYTYLGWGSDPDETDIYDEYVIETGKIKFYAKKVLKYTHDLFYTDGFLALDSEFTRL